MKIEIHVIQNHAPANLNRDDLGAPKTCYFGGVLRTRISSQCLKRSIRLSPEFKKLLGGIRTRQLAKLISDEVAGKAEAKKRAVKILKECGIEAKKDDKSDMLIYTTGEAIKQMALLLQNGDGMTDADLAKEFGTLISQKTAVPDMALTGRMLETGKLTDTTVEAALQAAHAISTHAAHPEVDYYVAADDIKGDDAGAGFLDEALFTSACFYKYFSIDWAQLVKNLAGNEPLAAHTVGAFLRALVLTNPTGKQNSYAAHNPPDGILIELKDTPISYANAFAAPVRVKGEVDIVSQSIAQLAKYADDLDVGYGQPKNRFWFSPNLCHQLTVSEREEGKQVERAISKNNLKSLDQLVSVLVSALGHNWADVQKVYINPDANS